MARAKAPLLSPKIRSDLPLRVRETVAAHKMLEKGDTVVCAVSGGLDSVVMLNLIAGMRDELGLEVIVAHLNHNLRGAESQRDLKFTKSLSSKLGFKFAGATLRKGELAGPSIQDAAREKRYAFLFKTAFKNNASKICLGHNLDDNAETVLMRFLKGSGLHGLAGIPPRRGMIVRPLIGVERGQIERYARENSISFVTDSSNLSDKYLRNDIRLRLLPLIKTRYNPNIIETLGRASRTLAVDDDYLSGAGGRALAHAVIERKKGAIVIDRLRVRSAHPAVLARIFFKIAEDLTGAPDNRSSHAESFIKMLRASRPNAVFRGSGVWTSREYDRVVFSTSPPRRASVFTVTLPVPGGVETPGGWVLTATLLDRPPVFSRGDRSSAYFDYDELFRGNFFDGDGALAARSMTPGDRMTPLGMKGHKKVKEIFIEEKVPFALRREVPMVVSGGSAAGALQTVLWLAGVKQSDSCKVKKTTKRILKLAFARAKP